MRMHEGDYRPYLSRLAEKQGAAVADAAQRLLARTAALSTEHCRIVTPPIRGDARLQLDVCVDIGEGRTRLYWLSDIGVLYFELSSSNTPKTLPPLSACPAFAAPGVLAQFVERVLTIEGTEQHPTRITITDLKLLEGDALGDFVAVIRWMIETLAHAAR